MVAYKKLRKIFHEDGMTAVAASFQALSKKLLSKNWHTMQSVIVLRKLDFNGIQFKVSIRCKVD